MFWEVNSYSESIDSLLGKEDLTLKELLDDEDILQDYKDQNKNLLQYLHRTEIIDELVTMITTEPPTHIADDVRFKYPNIACEILTSEVPALIERLVNSRPTLEKLYAFLEQDPPLNPLLTSFCSKTFGMLLSKKSDQDWFSYQCVCLQMLEFIKSRPDFLNTIYKHIGIPVIMDLLFQIITTIEGEELRNSLSEWLKEQQLVNNLIRMLGDDDDSNKHQNIAQFLCELIAHGRSGRQNELQKRGYVDANVDSCDSVIQTLEDEATTNLLLDLILTNKKESSIVSGITIILKLLENPIINEPVSDTALQFLADAEKEHHKKIVASIVSQIRPRVGDLVGLLKNPPPKNDIRTTVTVLSPPVGSTRLYICTLLSVLIETGNPDIITAICETDFFNALLDLFKQYCWNNILHNQVKKCFSYAFSAFESSEESKCTPSALQTHVLVDCKIASKLIGCWKHNDESQLQENGRRLGYMGHLIDMFDSLNLLVLVSHQFRALVESNLAEADLEYWQLVTNPTDGYLVKALKAQKSFLGGIDPNQTYSYEASISKDYQDENYTSEYYNDIDSNVQNSVDDLVNEELFEATCSSRNLRAFDTDLNNDDNWPSNDLKYTFDFTNNVFNDDLHDENGIFSSKHFATSSTMIPKNDTDWADFDSHFSEFQISDKNSFPMLEQSNSGHSNRNDADTLNKLDGPKEESASSLGKGTRRTFAEVTASHTNKQSDFGSDGRNDKNANDIKEWTPPSISTNNLDRNVVDNNSIVNEFSTSTTTSADDTTTTTVASEAEKATDNDAEDKLNTNDTSSTPETTETNTTEDAGEADKSSS